MAFKELLVEMHDQISEIMECTDLQYAALLNNNLRVVDETDERMGKVKERSEAIIEALIKEKETESKVRKYISIPTHIQIMAENMERISTEMRKKIKEAVLFSDRALAELEYMFESMRDMLINCRDMVLARNTLVARHLEESDKALVRNANEYATRHEERLIEGLCMPKSSSIYLNMLGAFKEMASHAKEIGKDLA